MKQLKTQFSGPDPWGQLRTEEEKMKLTPSTPPGILKVTQEPVERRMNPGQHDLVRAGNIKIARKHVGSRPTLYAIGDGIPLAEIQPEENEPEKPVEDAPEAEKFVGIVTPATYKPDRNAPWVPARVASVRPGADDHLAIPSLRGKERVLHTGSYGAALSSSRRD